MCRQNFNSVSHKPICRTTGVIKTYVGSVVVYKIIDPHNYLIMILDRKILRGIFEHKRLRPAVIRKIQGNVQHLAELRQIMNNNLKMT